MRKLKDKECTECGVTYTPTGSCSKRCSVCAPVVRRRIMDAAINKWQFANGFLTGEGSGSKKGLQASNYKHGRSVFRRWAKERKASVGLCEHCGKDIMNATHYEWVGHHKDHDPTNNVLDNLMLLCKQCHQIEHTCWNAFEGVTTIPKGSRADNSSKRTPSHVDDDIV